MPSAAADWLLDNTTTNVNTVITPGTWNNVRIGTNNAATLNIISGGELNNQSASIGYFASGVGEVFVTGPTAVWNNTSVLDIGYYGDGTLTVTSGGQVNGNASHIGYLPGSRGAVSVADSGSQFNVVGNLYVGDKAYGTLSISNGAAVSSNDIVIAANAAAADSYIIVTGNNSSLNTVNDLQVGYGASASLAIENGGVVNTGRNGLVGETAASSGVVTVSGTDSKWNNGNFLTVGRAGTGTLTIDNGATVTSNFSFIGDQAGGNGTVSVSGNGSTFANTGDLSVGGSGSGTLLIADGGQVSSAISIIGKNVNGVGQVNVSGADSRWAMDNDLTIGSNGSGVLTIDNLSTVSTGNGSGNVNIASSAGSTGTLIIGAAAGDTAVAAGVLQAATVTLGEGEANIVINHTDTSGDYLFGAAMTGTGSLNVYSGTTTLTGASTFAGDAVIHGGTVVTGANQALSANADYVISPAGTLDLHGFNQSMGSLNHAGVINFNGAPGTVLTVAGDYIGNGGMLVFNTTLGDDSSPTDKMMVNGNTSGNTNVTVNNLGGIGAKTLNGIELIHVNGISDGEFVKQGRIVAGAYEYSLARGTGADANNWYLSNTTPPDPDPKPYPAPDPKPQPKKDDLRPEPGVYTVNLAAANNMFVTRLHDRLGETQYIDALTGEKKVTSLWLRNEGGHNRSRDETGQLRTQANRYVVQLGGDIAQWSSNQQNRYHLGVMAGYGNSKSNTVSHQGYDAKGAVDGYSVGAYATWYANEVDKSGWHVDGWVQYSWFNNSVTGQDLASEEYKSNGVTASIESGYTFKLGESVANNLSYFIQPKAQVTWMGVKADDHREANGTRVQGEGDGNIQTRLGVKAFIKGYNDQDKGKDRVFQPFVEANWIHNTKDFGTTLNNVTVRQDGAANIGELKLGVEGQINKQVNLWGNVAQQVGNNGYSDTAVLLGAKYNF